jgi:Uma2 family endonuclease
LKDEDFEQRNSWRTIMQTRQFLDDIAAAQFLDDTEYPETDGLPMADSTMQYDWIVTFKGGLEAMFAGRDDVFVAGNIFWYPVQGNPKIVTAPDAMVVFGRPKGHRRSYRQWVEGDIAPQIVVEIMSYSNSAEEMLEKLSWYEQYGVQEYYLYNPHTNYCAGWIREKNILVKIQQMNGFRSPLLGITFLLNATTLTVLRPDGQTFEAYLELVNRAAEAEDRAEEAEERRKEAEERRKEAEADAQRFAAKLRELGINPDDV